MAIMGRLSEGKTMIRRLMQLIVSLPLILFALTCSDKEDADPTSGFLATLGDIQWPEKYNSTITIGEELQLRVPLDLNGMTESFHCWAKLGWRESIGEFIEWCDSGNVYLGIGASYADFSLGYHDSLEGIYTLRVGLTYLDGDAYSTKKAAELAEYNFYVGEEEYYWYDAELEYVYQYQCKIFKDERHWVIAKSPFNDTKVLWHKHERDTVLSSRVVVNDWYWLANYRYDVASYWYGDTSHPQQQYVLVGALGVVDPGDTTYIRDWTGVSANGANISCVASGFINDFTGIDRDSEYIMKYAATAHELGHVIGQGLHDFCGEHSGEHDTGAECVMNFTARFGDGDVRWYCTSPGAEVKDAFEFCQPCLEKLNQLEFLQQ